MSACHSVKLVAFRNLEQIGFSEEQVKSLAVNMMYRMVQMMKVKCIKKPGRPSDNIPGPYANDKEARATNNGALPPDLSLIIKARENGANYVYSLLTGFSNPPKCEIG